MTSLKHLSLSFLAAWITATVTMLVIMASMEPIIPDSVNQLDEFAFYVIVTAICTFVVVGTTWLLVVTPYFLWCIRRNSPSDPLAHIIIHGLLAIAISIIGVCLINPSLSALTILSTSAVFSSIAGILTLLNLHPSNIKNPTSRIIVPTP